MSHPARFGRKTTLTVLALLFGGSFAVPGATVARAAEDGITVPDGSPEDLVEFIKKTRRKRVRNVAQLRATYEAVLTAANKILGAKKLDDETSTYAVRAKLSALGLLQRYAASPTARLKYGKQVQAFAEELKTDKRKPIQTLAEATLIGIDTGNVSKLGEPERKKLTERALAFLKAGDFSDFEADARQRFSAAMGLARALEVGSSKTVAAEYYKQLAAVLKPAKHEKWQNYSLKMTGAARRMMLTGNPIVITGRTTDGKPFDWKDYKGKVVLIDFWATWCGPCIAELPNVKKNYARYRSKGFEIVGVNMDTRRERMQKFLKDRDITWVNLFEPDKKKQGWDHPLATYYGIMGIPAVILVDQKGNVVSLRARGPELGKQLRKLLGPPAEDADEKTK